MEMALLVILIAIVFAKPLLGLGNEIYRVANEKPADLLKYLGASAAFALTCLSLPKLLINLYMRHSGFWAYEVFGTDRGAFAELGTNIVVNYVFISLFMFSSGIVIPLDVSRRLKVMVAAINAFAVAWLAFLAWSHGAKALGGAVLVLCLLVAAYASIWVSLSVKMKAQAWWFPLVFSAVLLFLPYAFPAQASGIVEGGLRQMKVGGFEVKLCEPGDLKARETCESAWLLLRTPEKMYVTFLRDAGARKVFIATSDQYVVSYPTD